MEMDNIRTLSEIVKYIWVYGIKFLVSLKIFTYLNIWHNMFSLKYDEPTIYLFNYDN